ncbi:hypothetical protein [Vibrio splendidus]|uniref:hypothetical protein n=1 Tax=Vibrio splendidus TaxID=29497 RepID=UPI003D13BD20
MATGPDLYVKNVNVDLDKFDNPQFTARSELVCTIYEALRWLKLAPLDSSFVNELVEELRIDVITPRLMASSLHEFVCGDTKTGEYESV